MTETVVPGLEVLLADPALVGGRRFALLANQAAVTRGLEAAWNALAVAGHPPVRLLAPEHGLWGVAQDMEGVTGEREPSLGIEVVSLYGTTESSLAPAPAVLEDLDAVVVDLPDIGCRYYTFAATLAHVMAACATAGVEVIVCDRPNPLGGEEIEGGRVEEGCRSFVSEIPVPVRHGLTLGELALLLQARRYPDLSLAVVPCRGWRRSVEFSGTGLPWVAPSPNMPTPLTAALYPGACLVEATTLSEGRGTTRPFQLVGAPWVDGATLASRLNGVVGAAWRFRPTRFRPEFGKHSGEVCSGVEWHLAGARAAGALETGVRLLAEVRGLHPDRFSWRSQAYEFVADIPAIDLLTGSPLARRVIEGAADPDEVFGAWRSYSAGFRAERRDFLLYPESE